MEPCRLLTWLQSLIDARHRALCIRARDAEMHSPTPRAPILTKNHSSPNTESGES